ncbi:MAG: HAMP domain-containing histidine kinase [Eggerthellaceae bacterium]|nr:HAMP domain-containing histidine kinase [Eggerthellaceae bacterium]
MFKKLRIQFISIVMASVAIVLAIVFAGICVTEYQRSANEVNEALAAAINRAAERSPRFDDGFGMGGMMRMLEDEALEGLDDLDDLEEHADRFDDKFNGPRIGGRGDKQRSTVPVAVYTLTSSSTFTIASGYTTASIDSDVLQVAAERVSAVEEGSGTFSDLGLHYQKRIAGDTTYVAFADTANTDGWKSLALTLGIAALATLLVFFAIAFALSNWALKPVREAWDSQRQFVADASHDLKTPLTVILANSSILLKHPDHTIASESQWIESTQIEAQQMQGLVNEMLELAQVEAGEKVNVVKEKIDFSDLVDGATLLFDSMALERNCRYECDVEEGLSVMGNSQQLHKMVSTLVENAFKYVDENGTIEVILQRSGRNALLSVRNSGSSIPPEDLPHIFDRFYRTDKARTSGAGGFGLGLAIAREVARSHGGDITCTSSADEGTTFTATLPLA